VSTFSELFELAEQEIRAHIESAAADFTNYFVVQGAVLLASIRLWAQLCEKTETDERAMIESSDKSSLEKVVEDLAGSGDPEALMASQLLQAIVNRPQPFVAEARHWASTAFADEKGERRSTDPYDRPMPVMWSCPDLNCPPTALAVVMSLTLKVAARDDPSYRQRYSFGPHAGIRLARGRGPACGHRSAAMSGRVGVARNSALRRRTSSWWGLLEASAAAGATAFHGRPGGGGNRQVFSALDNSFTRSRAASSYCTGGLFMK